MTTDDDGQVEQNPIIEKKVVTLYQKDLYENPVTIPSHIENSELEDGDRLRVTIERIDNVKG